MLILIRTLLEFLLFFVLPIKLLHYLFIVHGDRERYGHIPCIRDLFASRTEEEAQLVTMVHDVVKGSAGHHGTVVFNTYTITFLTAAGERLRMRVSRRVYDSLYYPARGVLRRRGEWFLSFTPED
ncbi:MAG: hypothetical protein IJE07_14525 [Clostridia bacterium]|nr:hypothetical protein [Clostridia bacterium]